MRQVTTADVVEALSRMMRASGKKAKGDGERQRVQPGDIVNELAKHEHKGADPMVSQYDQCAPLPLVLGKYSSSANGFSPAYRPPAQHCCCILGCKPC